jgi:hypothetical protein
MGESMKKGATKCVENPLKMFFEFLRNDHPGTLYINFLKQI